MIKDFIEKKQPVKIGDILRELKNISRNTIKKDLQYLYSENIIEKIGEKRGIERVQENIERLKGSQG